MNNWFYRVGIFTLGMAFVVLVYIFIVALYPFEVVTLLENPISATPKKVYAGQNIEMTMRFEKHMNIKPSISYYLVDGEVILIKSESINRPLGYNERSQIIKIPKGVAQGKYYIQIDLTYPITSFRNIYYSWVTEEFEVLPATKEASIK